MTITVNRPEIIDPQALALACEAATDWRDLAEHLTPEQVNRLVRDEESGEAVPAYNQKSRLQNAGRFVAERIFLYVMPPAGALSFLEPGVDDDGRPVREFHTTSRCTSAGAVTIWGKQFADGSLSWRAHVSVGEDELDSAGLAELIAALLDAEAEIEALQ